LDEAELTPLKSAAVEVVVAEIWLLQPAAATNMPSNHTIAKFFNQCFISYPPVLFNLEVLI
jgi:hypothetical protein